MTERTFELDEDAGLGSAVERTAEALLSALRLRDGAALEKIAAEAAEAARAARAEFVRDGVKRDPRSHQLGARELLESLSVRAAERHDRNRQFEAARQKHARAMLVEIGRAPLGAATPTLLSDKLGVALPNVSRILKPLRDTGLVVEVADDAHTNDRRARPLRLTNDACAMLDQINPGWAEEGAYAIDPKLIGETDDFEETLPSSKVRSSAGRDVQIMKLGSKAVRVETVFISKRTGFEMSAKAPAKSDDLEERSRKFVSKFYSGRLPRAAFSPARVRGRPLGSKA